MGSHQMKAFLIHLFALLRFALSNILISFFISKTMTGRRPPPTSSFSRFIRARASRSCSILFNHKVNQSSKAQLNEECLAPFGNLLNAFSWACLILEQITLQAGNLRNKKKTLCVRTQRQGDWINPDHTLISPSGIASAKRLASWAISDSSRIGTAWADALRLDPGGFFCEASTASDSDSLDDDSDGRDGKKHLKMPSACHFVALVKLTQTSIRPGLLSAGSRRSM